MPLLVLVQTSITMSSRGDQNRCSIKQQCRKARTEMRKFNAAPHREEEQEEAKVEDEEGGNAAADQRGEAHGSFREVGDAQAALPGRLVADQQRVRHVHEAVQVILLCTRTDQRSDVTSRWPGCTLHHTCSAQVSGAVDSHCHT